MWQQQARKCDLDNGTGDEGHEPNGKNVARADKGRKPDQAGHEESKRAQRHRQCRGQRPAFPAPLGEPAAMNAAAMKPSR